MKDQPLSKNNLMMDRLQGKQLYRLPMESQQAKQERPTVKSDSSSLKTERQSNTVQERTVQKPVTSTAPTDRASQRSITKERQSTVQRVPLQNTK